MMTRIGYAFRWTRVSEVESTGAFSTDETVVMVVTSTGFKSTREILEQIAAER